MNFLHPQYWWLMPLVLLPIVIHLIHRRRHRELPWAATMFLQQPGENRRGRARLKRWLILAARVVVVAAIVLSLLRPMLGGRLGNLAGQFGNQRTVILLLDRSASMQRKTASGVSLQTLLLQQVDETLQIVQPARRVVIGSGLAEPLEMSVDATLLRSPLNDPSDSAATLPDLVSRALQYISTNELSQAELWICSDNSHAAWQLDSPAWQAIRESVQASTADLKVEQFVVDDSALDPGMNRSIEVQSLRQVSQPAADEQATSKTQLVMSLRVIQDQPPDQSQSESVEVQVNVGEVTHLVQVPIQGVVNQQTNVRVPLGDDDQQRFGWVALPPDSNPADNRWYFVSTPADAIRLGLVMQASSDALWGAADVLGTVAFESDELDDEALADLGVLLWQGDLPGGDDQRQIDAFLQRGGQVVFFPPATLQTATQTNEFQSVRWNAWQRDQERSGQWGPLEFAYRSNCSIAGELVAEAVDEPTGEALIGSRQVGRGKAWFCGADVTDRNSQWVNQGAALFYLLHQVTRAATEMPNQTRQQTAGKVRGLSGDMDASFVTQLCGDSQFASRAFGDHAGVYQVELESADSTEWVAVNRPAADALAKEYGDSEFTKAFPDWDWNRNTIQSSVGPGSGLLQEVWSAIWMLVIVGLIVEACLSLQGGMAKPKAMTLSSRTTPVDQGGRS